MKNILDLSFEDLKQELVKLQEKPFRAIQLWQWIYNRGIKEFSEINNISKEFKIKLKENYFIGRPEITEDLISSDGTRKWLLKFGCHEVETVFIPESDRGTLCISSQVGCTLTCKFCHTGTQTLVRNLTSYEILAQLLIAKDKLNDWPASKESRIISNIVMMGMGEPLYNYDNVKEALLSMMRDDGLALSRRRITLSTSGVVPEIIRCGKDLGVNLAISLHATNDELRNDIMPINKKYPIKELIKSCHEYAELTNTRRITFEYVMLKNVNDQKEHAYELVKLIKNLNAIVNLIPFNPWPGSQYETSSMKNIKEFAKIILDSGFPAPIRSTRGEDILAACGQLKSESLRKRKSKINLQ